MTCVYLSYILTPVGWLTAVKGNATTKRHYVRTNYGDGDGGGGTTDPQFVTTNNNKPQPI